MRSSCEFWFNAIRAKGKKTPPQEVIISCYACIWQNLMCASDASGVRLRSELNWTWVVSFISQLPGNGTFCICIERSAASSCTFCTKRGRLQCMAWSTISSTTPRPVIHWLEITFSTLQALAFLAHYENRSQIEFFLIDFSLLISLTSSKSFRLSTLHLAKLV